MARRPERSGVPRHALFMRGASGEVQLQSQNVLEMRGICKSFPGVRALHNVSFSLRKGEVHALMGENGAGKSTLIKVMTGVYEKDAGEIVIEGKSIHFRSPQDAQDFGVGTVYQEIALCPNLTVAENMFIGRSRRAFVSWKRMKEKTALLLDSLGIPARPTQALSSCSLAVQQMIAIAPRDRHGLQNPHSGRADLLAGRGRSAETFLAHARA